ncbi:hypothetical protein BU24DRAFT_337493 [Aaosphaeria arxii CBS 175.79]|uniref:Chromatin modification-related protein n=1 Tax=Aaosphaeria arxii CBS 175.79 TaxID=1450172 RepID=A0A6A5Y5G5_9PLEO|nr:uncharacterized protein BU24DRAFT_337493 [Aaosphaeria arxii CBS 175.79]KAF2020738.1 hypothetical protein BU24DRAFT_337493 [Aaosphaeria arxii CBS 175.79]
MPPAGSSRTAVATTASDRRQSTRQGRTSVTRPTNYYARTFAGRLSAMGGLEQTPPAVNSNPGFLPALTHFTQAVDAFPKELIKHFSMFKEVEAKMHDSEQMLEQLFREIARQPVPTVRERHSATQTLAAGDNSANNSLPTDRSGLPQSEQAQLERRELFLRLRVVLASMLATLDEKMVVLNSAKGTKDRGLARMLNSYAHLDEEISEEARYGSLTHWAYADKEEKKKGGASHERQRREVVAANNLAAAAQHVHDVDSIAAKSEARREAMLANKRNRHNHVDSEFEDRPVKKTHKRKAVAADAGAAVGLGIMSNGVAQPGGKRKKTEKALAAAAAATAAAPAMERSLSGALKAAGGSGRGGGSPRATPATEGGPKRKPRTGLEQAQRKNQLPTHSPPLASSPLASSFAISKATGGAADRPASARARKNSTANSVASVAQEAPNGRRPSSSHSIRPPPTTTAVEEPEQPVATTRETTSTKVPTPKEVPEPPQPPKPSTLKHEEPEVEEPEKMEIDVPTPAPVNTTKASKSSKTATPVVSTFPEIPMARSRSTRNANNGNGNGTSQTSSENNSTSTGTVSKRGPKKSAQTTNSAASPALKATKEVTKPDPPSSASSVAPDPEYSDGADEDGDEPRFCFCNEVSYGAMVGCDNESCPREWFHLACVNLDKPPPSRTKWFCSDQCKEAYNRTTGKGKGGRPGSSRQ